MTVVFRRCFERIFAFSVQCLSVPPFEACVNHRDSIGRIGNPLAGYGIRYTIPDHRSMRPTDSFQVHHAMGSSFDDAAKSRQSNAHLDRVQQSSNLNDPSALAPIAVVARFRSFAIRTIDRPEKLARCYRIVNRLT